MPRAWHIGNCLEYPRPDRAPGRRLRLPSGPGYTLHKEGDPTNVTAAASNYNIYIYNYIYISCSILISKAPPSLANNPGGLKSNPATQKK